MRRVTDETIRAAARCTPFVSERQQSVERSSRTSGLSTASRTNRLESCLAERIQACLRGPSERPGRQITVDRFRHHFEGTLTFTAHHETRRRNHHVDHCTSQRNVCDRSNERIALRTNVQTTSEAMTGPRDRAPPPDSCRIAADVHRRTPPDDTNGPAPFHPIQTAESPEASIISRLSRSDVTIIAEVSLRKSDLRMHGPGSRADL